MKAGEVRDHTVDKKDISYKISQPSRDDWSKVTMNYDAAKLTAVDADRDDIERPIDAAWIGMEIDKPSLYKDDAKDSSNPITVKATVNGKEFKADEDGYHIFTAITPEKIKEALKSDGNITATYKVVWTYEREDEEDLTTEQVITVVIKVANVTISNPTEDSTLDDLIWTENNTKDYQATLPASTPEDPSKPGESDPQPKTGERIPMALVGMMTLGLAGAYTFKKSMYSS